MTLTIPPDPQIPRSSYCAISRVSSWQGDIIPPPLEPQGWSKRRGLVSGKLSQNFKWGEGEKQGRVPNIWVGSCPLFAHCDL